MRQFIHEAFHDEQIVRRTDTTPPAHQQSDRHVVAYPFHFYVWNLIGSLGGAFHQIAVQAILAHGHRRPAAEHRAPGDAVAKPNRPAIRIEYGGDMVVVHGTHDVLADVLLASPNDFEGIFDLFGKSYGLLDGVRFQTAAEAAAQVMVMQHDFIGRQTGDFRGLGHTARRYLGADP